MQIVTRTRGSESPKSSLNTQTETQAHRKAARCTRTTSCGSITDTAPVKAPERPWCLVKRLVKSLVKRPVKRLLQRYFSRVTATSAKTRIFSSRTLASQALDSRRLWTMEARLPQHPKRAIQLFAHNLYYIVAPARVTMRRPPSPSSITDTAEPAHFCTPSKLPVAILTELVSFHQRKI